MFNLFIGVLFPIVSADLAAAIEDKNKDSSESSFLNWHKDNNDKSESPAPILSIGSCVNAGHLISLFFLLIIKAPNFPWVTVKDLETKKNKSFQIVGKDEADIKKNLIYFRSPIGRSLIGKKVEDLVIVKTPSGEKNFEIIDVKYIWFIYFFSKVR